MVMRWSVRIHPFMYKFPFTVMLLFYRKLHFAGWYLGCPLLRHRGELEPSRWWRENSAPPQDRTRWLVWSEAARRGVTYSILWYRSVWVWTSFPFAMSSIIWLVTIALYGRSLFIWPFPSVFWDNKTSPPGSHVPNISLLSERRPLF